MAATGRSSFAAGRFALAVLLALPALTSARHEDETPRAVISHICTALAGGNPAEALSYFSQSLPQREQLGSDMDALTNAYEVTSAFEVTDENAVANEARVEGDWALTLRSKVDLSQRQGSRHVVLQMKREGKTGKWKVVALDPADLFSPIVR